MSKYKAPKGKPKKTSAASAIPCLILILTGMGLLLLLLYGMLKSAN